MTSEIFQINVVQVLKSLRIFLNKYNGRMRDRAILYYARLLNLRLWKRKIYLQSWKQTHPLPRLAEFYFSLFVHFISKVTCHAKNRNGRYFALQKSRTLLKQTPTTRIIFLVRINIQGLKMKPVFYLLVNTGLRFCSFLENRQNRVTRISGTWQLTYVHFLACVAQTRELWEMMQCQSRATKRWN